MLIQYAYIKPRSQFGKQCFFEESEINVEENIQPDPRLMRRYVQRSRCDRGAQESAQFALHEVRESPGRKGTKFGSFGINLRNSDNFRRGNSPANQKKASRLALGVAIK